ncbi:major facilitator superfamily domain-containing protein [Mycena capillaripes]|nr:major facilitator superfamily domain-containing protein [Mycena capillaripes]
MSGSSRSLVCFSIILNALCAGGVFTFPLLSPVLAQHVKLTQPQLTSIVLAGMAGQYPCTPLVGKIVDRHGPWVSSFIASLLFPLAFGGFSYQVHHMLEAPQPQASVALLVVLFGLAGFATVFSCFSSLFAATRNFPRYPGVATGTVMALFGLSPLFLSFVASSFFTDGSDASLDLVRFLAFLAILTGVVHIIGASNLHVSNYHLPAMVPPRNDEEADETTALLRPEGRNNANGSLLDLVRDPYFWAFFVLLALTLGPCEMIMSNVGTIVLSLPSASFAVLSPGAASSQVKALAVSNTVTRLLTGPIADFVSPIISSEPLPSPRKHYISRTVFLVGPAVVLCFAFLWMEIAVRSQADIWVLSVCTGIAYGATFTVLPSIITSVWGAQNAARNFGIVVYAPLIGTTIFSYLYAFISAYHAPSGGLCRGPVCWRTTFLISGGFQVVGIICGLVLWRGWKGLI